jgi:PQQ-dependent catabolism-associated CXXCW motif protein
MAGHVFISHASENRDAANELVTLIEGKGVTAWIAPRDVRPGYDYSEELQAALENCAAFVVLVTDDANTSPYVRAETEMAFSCQKPMLPVRLGEVAPAPGLAFFLKIRHWTEAWGPKRDTALARLVLELQTLTGTAPSWAPRVGPATPSPPPAPPPPAPPPPAPAPAAPPPLASEPAPAPARPAGSSQRLVVWIVIIGFVLAAAAAAIILLNRRDAQAPLPGPTDNGFVPAPMPAPAPGPAPPAQPRNYANELTDLGVAMKSELESNVGSATPLNIPVGSRITTEEAQRLLADNRATPVDVLVDAHPQTLPGALYMPAGGQGGTFEDVNQAQFALPLAQATSGDTARPLIFFCAGASCWESYNAALRANAAGYSQIYWYRGGLAAWQEAGLPLMALPAPFGSAAPVKQ